MPKQKPVQTPSFEEYSGQNIDRVVLSLGGIGTVSLGGCGDLRDWEIMSQEFWDDFLEDGELRDYRNDKFPHPPASLEFFDSVSQSDLPDCIKEAALFNMSSLRSQTTFRTASGHLSLDGRRRLGHGDSEAAFQSPLGGHPRNTGRPPRRAALQLKGIGEAKLNGKAKQTTLIK